MNFFERHRLKKILGHLIKEAQHVRNLREDLAMVTDLARLDRSVQKARMVLKSGNWPQAESVANDLGSSIQALMPARKWAGLRENLEIIAVALAVAMAFRTYFVQPFKIPTSSMSPTLCGIHYRPQAKPDWFDRTPLRLAKWLIFGAWYQEIRSQASGILRIMNTAEGRVFVVNGTAHRVFNNMADHASHGDTVVRGQLLASGLRLAGDHIFVNKMGWHFRKPHRGEIMVFKTNGIQHPQIKQNEHYVKRMVGLPGETLIIKTPCLYINGQEIMQPRSIARTATQLFGYDGYQQIGSYLTNNNNCVKLTDDQFFACGDNQLNSLDSRYWGPVQRANLVGPAFFVYWPISPRWGFAD